MDFNKREYLAYRVGGLLYTPALKKDIDKKIINDEINKLMSISFAAYFYKNTFSGAYGAYPYASCGSRKYCDRLYTS